MKTKTPSPQPDVYAALAEILQKMAEVSDRQQLLEARLAAVEHVNGHNEGVLVDAVKELGGRVFDLESGLLVDTESKQRLDEISGTMKQMVRTLTVLYERSQAARNRPPKGTDPSVN